MREAYSSFPAPQIFNRILLGNNGSRGARKALYMAIDLAKRYAAELHQITVNERLPRHVEQTGGFVGIGRVLSTGQDAADYSEQISQEGSQAATAAGFKLLPHVAYGDPVEHIAKVVKDHGFGLLVIGFNGHSAMFGHHWGSTSQQLEKSAACSVLIVQ